MSMFPEDPEFQAIAHPVSSSSQSDSPSKTALEYAQDELRRERDRLLLETDWVVTKATESGVPVSASWVAYRQALRDLPNTATIALNKYEHLDWSLITMPEKP